MHGNCFLILLFGYPGGQDRYRPPSTGVQSISFSYPPIEPLNRLLCTQPSFHYRFTFRFTYQKRLSAKSCRLDAGKSYLLIGSLGWCVWRH